MGLTREVAEFASALRLEDIPDKVRSLAKRSIIDALGLAVAGARGRVGEITRDYVAKQACPGPATVIGGALHTTPRLAAFANGVAIHADDYDDTQLSGTPDRVYGLLTHPTAPVLPAALAVAEELDAGGGEVLTSYLAGVEVETKVAEAISSRHYEDGFHTTATIGAIGAASAAARMRGLTAPEHQVALALGASQAGGLRENFGTMIKPFHAGRAAESGVIAASLASMGFTGAGDILEAPRGFFNAAGGGFDESLIDGHLGDPWTHASPGISIKPHPSGSLTHPAMTAMLELITKNDLVPEDVERIIVRASRHMPTALIHHEPQTGLEAKFSMEFCMAILLLERQAGLAQFTDDVVRRPDVASMRRRIEFGSDDAADAAGFHTMRSFIDVYLKDGTHLFTEADFAKGSPQMPMSDDELVAKLEECLAWGGCDPGNASEVADRVFDLEKEDSLHKLFALIGTDGR
jgi:2-methylcitrate dehydratase PrpD